MKGPSRRRRLLGLAALGVVCLAPRVARAGDPAAARDELKQGYALKQQGNCREAAAHFTVSVALDPEPKSLLNLADCEQKLGDLLAARRHATQGRELAQGVSDGELAGVADGLLAAIEKRLPWLTIRLSREAPEGCTVSRDGLVVDPTLFGVPVAVNPGTQVIVVSAPGRAERRFYASVEEGVRDQIEVEAGPLLVAQPPPIDDATAPEHRFGHKDIDRDLPVDAPVTRVDDDGRNPSRVPAYAAFGVGLVGLTVGVAAGIAGSAKRGDLQAECQADGGCPSSAQGDLDGFRSLRTWSTVGYVVGAAGLVGGAVLWLLVPAGRTTSATARLWVAPTAVGVSGGF